MTANNKESSPLLLAFQLGKEVPLEKWADRRSTIRGLLDGKADVNQANNDDHTAAWCAIQTHDVELLRLVLEYKPDVVSTKGKNRDCEPISAADLAKQWRYMNPPMHRLVQDYLSSLT